MALTATEPPHEATHWTAAAMAKATGISVSSVQRIWKAHGLAPHRLRRFKLSRDPDFVPKLRDVVGLYVDPPAHAVVQTFVPRMIEQGTPGAIINTGSKQGITTPPGDTAYNVSKAGVKGLIEAVAHELRNIDRCRITAHLLIPGFTFTGHHGTRRQTYRCLVGRAGRRFHDRCYGER